MAKQQVIRIGDTIKVLNPRFIKRVGYPLIWTDLIDEVEQDPRTQEAWDIIKGIKHNGAVNPDMSLGKLFAVSSSKIPKDFIRAIARERVYERGFGGRKRALIYYDTVERGTGTIHSDDAIRLPLFYDNFEVTDKKIAKTGDYYPPTSGRDGYYSEEDWFEPGGLENCKTHVLLLTSMGWIERTDVELVRRAPA